MKTENSVLKQMALDSLKDRWGLVIGAYAVYLIFSLIMTGIPLIGTGLSLALSGPLMLGFAMFSLAISRNQEVNIDVIFQGFNDFGTALVAYLLMLLYVVLWALLLVVPGIMAALSYSMTFYILADDGSIGATEALDKSKKMMDGHKMRYFLLILSFFGWILLSLLTFGLGFLLLVPYMQVTSAKFYEEIKSEAILVEVY